MARKPRLRRTRRNHDLGALAAADPAPGAPRPIVSSRAGRRLPRGPGGPWPISLLHDRGHDPAAVDRDDRKHPRFNWVRVPDSNGLAVDPSGRSLYVDRTAIGTVDRVSIAHPHMVQVIGRLGAGVLPDDMTIDPRGILYIAGFGTGKLYRLDPRTHASCAIATRLGNPTAAVLGGSGWPRRGLVCEQRGR